MRLAWQMGELDVEAMLGRLERHQFDRWFVAYHELRLDGSRPAAQVVAAIHNELMPVHAYLGLHPESVKIDDCLAPVEFVLRPKPGEQPAELADEPDLFEQMAAAWST